MHHHDAKLRQREREGHPPDELQISLVIWISKVLDPVVVLTKLLLALLVLFQLLEGLVLPVAHDHECAQLLSQPQHLGVDVSEVAHADLGYFSGWWC